MKHVSILIPLGVPSISHIETTYQILSHVNSVFDEGSELELFTIQLIGLRMPASEPGVRFGAIPDLLIADVRKTDLIIIPATIGDLNKSMELNEEFIPWIKEQRQNGAEVASFCVGTFLLAATGLLDHKQCSTHWFAASSFRKMFPAANLLDDRIMTDDKGIYTSGGAHSYLNLLLYIIEKYAGRHIAILMAKTYMIDIDRTRQSPFFIFQGQKEHGDDTVKKAQSFIEENFDEKITIDMLAGQFTVSRRSLQRRFKLATGNTILEYIQRVKIEAAKKDFESSRKNINEVMYDVGYSDSKGFRLIFKKVTGMSPAAYRKKYNKELAG